MRRTDSVLIVAQYFFQYYLPKINNALEFVITVMYSKANLRLFFSDTV